MAKVGARTIYKPLASNYNAACREIAYTLSKSTISTKNELLLLIRGVSGRYQLQSIPRYSDILKEIPFNKNLRKMLLKKPTKSASGVIVIAVMAEPFNCPHGKCVYCPGGVELDVPLSYTGKEPIAIRARSADYDPYLQIRSRINHYLSRGHDVSKVELVIVGGTFPFMPLDYQRQFVKGCYDALNAKGIRTNCLEEAKFLNETSDIRCVGLTVETKPDYCKRQHIDIMLELGITRLEIGVQTLDNTIYRKVNRGHNLDDVYEAFQTAKDSGYKIVAHMMPGLPGSTPQRDLEDFRFLFGDERLRPDMLKIYPTLVLKDTGLYHLYKAGKYSTYSDEEFANLLTEIKKIVPNWVRIMRIQREIDSPDIIAGPKLGNLRQLVQKRLSKSGYECNCIRCREVGIPNGNIIDYNPMVMRSNYVSSDGMESFLSLEDPKTKCLFAFLRLRRLKNPHRNELTVSGVAGAIIRELHVYGQVTDVGKCSAQGSFQHRGFGSKLLRIAEEIVSGEFGLKKLSVISAVGTREYYKKFGYKNDGPYMSKIL